MNRVSNQDRKVLIRLASNLPKGSEVRRVILSGIQKLSYYSVILPPGSSKWQDPRRRLTRGAFDTEKQAHDWAKKNVSGVSYEVKHYPDVRGSSSKTAGDSLDSLLDPVLEKFTGEAVKKIVELLKKKGPHITDAKADSDSTATFNIRGKPGKISVFVDLTGGRTAIEVHYSGKKDWMKRVPLNITRDVDDFVTQAYYAIPSRLLE